MKVGGFFLFCDFSAKILTFILFFVEKSIILCPQMDFGKVFGIGVAAKRGVCA